MEGRGRGEEKGRTPMFEVRRRQYLLVFFVSPSGPTEELTALPKPPSASPLGIFQGH